MILDKVLIDYYGAPTPLRQMSQVSVQDGTTLVISPFDKSMVKEIEKALIKADLGINPNSDGIVIRLVFPPMTEDKRKEVAKTVKKSGEDAKVAIRNVRRDMVDELKYKKVDSFVNICSTEELLQELSKYSLQKAQKVLFRTQGLSVCASFFLHQVRGS